MRQWCILISLSCVRAHTAQSRAHYEFTQVNARRNDFPAQITISAEIAELLQ